MTIRLSAITATFPEAGATRTVNSARTAGTELSAPVTMMLPRGVVMSLQSGRERSWWRGRRDPAGLRLQCLSGELWVTQAGDPVDHHLRPGEVFETTGGGRVVVQALAPSAINLSEVPAQALGT